MSMLVIAVHAPQVHMYIMLRSAEHSMLVLDDPRHITSGVELLQERSIVVGIVDRDHDVDDRLRGEAGDSRRADVLDAARHGTERRCDPIALGLEPRRPRRVVLD